MSLQTAKYNWQNFFRQMVGLPKMYPVKVVRNEKAKQFPLIQIKKAGDVGYDVYATESVTIPAPTPVEFQNYTRLITMYKRCLKIANNNNDDEEMFQFYMEKADRCHKEAMDCLPRAMIPTGIKLEMPDNIWCTVEARSSAGGRYLITPDSIIDSGYRGEFFAVVFNIGYEPQTINVGDRVCQLVFHEKTLIKPIEVDELSKSERGETGFGSSGK